MLLNVLFCGENHDEKIETLKKYVINKYGSNRFEEVIQRNGLRHYLFCDNLLVAPIMGTESDEREVYLPEGEWGDFFTGERVEAGRFKVCTEGIPVYRKINI